MAYWKGNVTKEKATTFWQFEIVGSRRQRKRDRVSMVDRGIPISPSSAYRKTHGEEC